MSELVMKEKRESLCYGMEEESDFRERERDDFWKIKKKFISIKCSVK